MKVYRFDDGAIHWVAAPTQERADEIFRRTCDEAFGSTVVGYTCRELSDDDGGRMPMASVVKTVSPTGDFLASSEW